MPNEEPLDRTKPLAGRREFLASAAALGVAALVGGRPAFAAGYPERDVSFIVPYPPGGAYDQYVRVLLQPLSQALPNHVTVVPNNVSGAGGARAANVLYRSKPDGYTISVLNAIGLILLKLKGGTIGFDLNELTWIGNLARDEYALVVAPNSKFKTVTDLQRASRTSPIKFTAPGPGTASYAAILIGTHLLDIQSQLITGYRGASDCMVAVTRGDGDATILTLPAVRQMTEGKFLRVLATFQKQSSIKGAEDATTLKVPELAEIIEVRPVAAPPHLDPEVTHILSDALIKAMKDPAVVDWAAKTGATLDPMTAEETTKVVREQSSFMARWKELLHA